VQERGGRTQGQRPEFPQFHAALDHLPAAANRTPQTPGFVRDPYKEYSEPWFGTHKVLRGGSFAAPARLLRHTFRNFYQAHRGDVFCGFRTCALD